MPGKSIDQLHGEVALRSDWQLYPQWPTDIEQHIVFIDQTLARQWPMSEKRWQFIEHWAAQCQAQLVHGILAQLQAAPISAQMSLDFDEQD